MGLLSDAEIGTGRGFSPPVDCNLNKVKKFQLKSKKKGTFPHCWEKSAYQDEQRTDGFLPGNFGQPKKLKIVPVVMVSCFLGIFFLFLAADHYVLGHKPVLSNHLPMNSLKLLPIAPILCVTTLSLVVLVLEAIMKQSEKTSYTVSVIGLLLTIIISLAKIIHLTGTAFNGMVTIGGTGNLFAALFAASALLTIVLSRNFLQKEHVNFGEYYLLTLFATLGMMLMAAAADSHHRLPGP